MRGAAVGLAIILAIGAFFPGLGAFLLNPVGALIGALVLVAFVASIADTDEE